MSYRAPTHDGPAYDAADMAKETSKSGPLSTAFDGFGSAIRQICEATSDLEVTLAPVLVGESPKMTGEDPSDRDENKLACPLITKLQDIIGLLHLRIQAIKNLRERIDL